MDINGISTEFFKLKSNIIKGKIQPDQTFAAAAAIANLKKNKLILI